MISPESNTIPIKPKEDKFAKFMKNCEKFLENNPPVNK